MAILGVHGGPWLQFAHSWRGRGVADVVVILFREMGGNGLLSLSCCPNTARKRDKF